MATNLAPKSPKMLEDLINRQKRKELFVKNNRVFIDMIDFVKSHGGNVPCIHFLIRRRLGGIRPQDLFKTISASLWSRIRSQ